MKKTLTNWIAVLIALSPLGYLALVWDSLPQSVPVHFDSEMKPDRMGEKSELWLVGGIMAVVSIGMYFLLKNIHRFDPKRKQADGTATFQKLALGLVVFLAAFSFLIISSSKTGEVSSSLLFPLLGLMFAFIGNYMNNIKPNYFAGFRLPWTLSDDENWRKTHQLGGKIWFVGGMLIAVVCLFLPSSTAFIVFISVMVVMVLVPAIYSYRLYKKHA
jgi:uncharacterized membrane protein